MGFLDIFKNKQQEQGTNYSVMPPIQSNPLDASAHIWALSSNDDSLMNFLMSQQGKYFDKQQNKWIPVDSELGFNEVGLLEIHRILGSVANKSNALSFLDKSEVKDIMKYTLKTLIRQMTINKKRWDLKNWARDGLYRNSENILFLFLTKTINGHTANLHFSGGGVSESISHRDNFDTANNSGGWLK